MFDNTKNDYQTQEKITRAKKRISQILLSPSDVMKMKFYHDEWLY